LHQSSEGLGRICQKQCWNCCGRGRVGILISSPCMSGSHHSGPRIEGISYSSASSRHILSVESYIFNALIRGWIIQTKENLLASGTASSGLRMADARPLFAGADGASVMTSTLIFWDYKRIHSPSQLTHQRAHIFVFLGSSSES
jgi:hypothetical protein